MTMVLRRVMTALAVMLWLAVPALAEGPLTGGRFNELMNAYYRSPDPEAAVGWLIEGQLPQLTEPITRMGVAAFYAQVFNAAPETAAVAVKAMTLPGMDKAKGAVVATAVSMATVPDKARLLEPFAAAKVIDKPMLNKLATAPAMDFKTLRPVTPTDVNICWASFFATGGKDYILKVIPLLSDVSQVDEAFRKRMSDLTDRSRGGDSGARSELSRQGAAQAASLTLVAYAAAHRPVWQTLQDYAARHKNRAGEIAREIVSRTPEPK